MGVMFNCPNCGKPMESGFLGTESVFTEVAWFKEKTIFGTGGESLDLKGKLSMTYVEGYRCKDCRNLILKY